MLIYVTPYRKKLSVTFFIGIRLIIAFCSFNIIINNNIQRTVTIPGGRHVDNMKLLQCSTIVINDDICTKICYTSLLLNILHDDVGICILL